MHRDTLRLIYAQRRAMIDPKQALLSSVRYLRQHPEEILRQLKNGSRLRFGLPVVALQWLASEFETGSPGSPHDVEISAAPPGLRIKATVEQMGTLIRADCVVIVESMKLDAREARIELRLQNVSLRLLDDTVQTPLAALIRSGTLDISRLASLVAYMPSRPAALIEAVDDRLVLDLMKIPQIGGEGRLRRGIGLLSKVLAIDSIASQAEHLDIAIRPLPNGLAGALK